VEEEEKNQRALDTQRGRKLLSDRERVSANSPNVPEKGVKRQSVVEKEKDIRKAGEEPPEEVTCHHSQKGNKAEKLVYGKRRVLSPYLTWKRVGEECLGGEQPGPV